VKPDDDLIGRALGNRTESTDAPPPHVLAAAIEHGAVRRRRRLLGAWSLAAAVLLITGVAIATAAGDDDTIVGVSPSTIDPTATTSPVVPGDPESSAVVVTTMPTTAHVPRPTTSTSTIAPLGTTTTIPHPSSSTTSTTTSTTTTTTTPPGDDAVAAALPRPCPADFVLDSSVVSFDTTTEVAAPTDVFFVSRTMERGTRVELWASSGPLAGMADTFPSPGFDCVNSLAPLHFDGKWMWAWIGVPDPWCQQCDVPSALLRGNVATGELVVLWTSETAEPILDVHPDGVGGALIVTGPAKGKPFVVVQRIDASGEDVIVASWTTQSSVVWSARFSPDGQRVAHGQATPSLTRAELRLLDVTTMAERVIDLSGQMVNPTVRAWSPDARSMIVDDVWENLGTATIDVDVAEPAASLREAGISACWLADGHLAVGRWIGGYGEELPAPGPVEVQDRDGTPIGTIGSDLYGGQLACLEAGRVAVLARPVGDGRVSYDEPSIEIIGPAGARQTITSDGLRALYPNG
jgi:hypothetical protein